MTARITIKRRLYLTATPVSLQRQTWRRGGIVKPRISSYNSSIYSSEGGASCSAAIFFQYLSKGRNDGGGGTVKPHVYPIVLLNLVFIQLQLQYLYNDRDEGAGLVLKHVYVTAIPVSLQR